MNESPIKDNCLCHNVLNGVCVYASRAAGGAPVVLPVVEQSRVVQDWPRAGLAGRVWRGQAAPLAGRTSTKDKREWQRKGKENLMNIHTTLIKKMHGSNSDIHHCLFS